MATRRAPVVQVAPPPVVQQALSGAVISAPEPVTLAEVLQIICNSVAFQPTDRDVILDYIDQLNDGDADVLHKSSRSKASKAAGDVIEGTAVATQ